MVKFDELPVEIQEKMLEEQVNQGNKRDPEVFRKAICASQTGFTWNMTCLGDDWGEILLYKNYTPFYNLYPKNYYPRIMEVSNTPDFTDKIIRVVIAHKCNRYISWSYAETFKEAEKEICITIWNYAREPQKEVCLTFKDISDGKGKGVDPSLIRIVDK